MATLSNRRRLDFMESRLAPYKETQKKNNSSSQSATPSMSLSRDMITPSGNGAATTGPSYSEVQKFNEYINNTSPAAPAVPTVRERERDDYTPVAAAPSAPANAYNYQGNYAAYSTNPYAQDAITAQQNAIEALLAQYDAQQRRLSRQIKLSKQQAADARNAALEQSLSLYGQQQDQANRDAEAAARQAYISRMLQQRDLGQQLSAAGYSGGMTDSAYLRLANDYENSRNSIMNQRDQQLAALALAMQQERSQAAADIANTNAQFDLSYNDALADIAIARAQAEAEGNEALAKLYASMRDSAATGNTGVRSPRAAGTPAAEYDASKFKTAQNKTIDQLVANGQISADQAKTLKELAAGTYRIDGGEGLIDSMGAAQLALQQQRFLGNADRTALLNYVNRNSNSTNGKLLFINQLVQNGSISEEMGRWLTEQVVGNVGTNNIRVL